MNPACDECWYNVYDEEADEYFCEKDIDEDDYARLLMNPKKRCPCFIRADDYFAARHQ